jgi:hypothetical protein
VTTSKPFKSGAVLVLAAAAGVFLLFSRMYQNDMKALKGFLAAYERFDEAMPDPADKVHDAGLGPAEAALAELQAGSFFRLSSLIKNEGELMDQAREVADLAGRELDGIRTRDEALTGTISVGVVEPSGLDLSGERLKEQRVAAFARFMELGGVSGHDERSKLGGVDHGP